MARYFHQPLSHDPSREDNESILLRRLLLENIRVVDTADREDAVRDFAAALLGKEIEITDSVNPSCPNGVRIGSPKAIRESRMYDGLPPVITLEQYDQGVVQETGAYYPIE